MTRDYGLELQVLNELKNLHLDAKLVRNSGATHASEDVYTDILLIQCKDSTKSNNIPKKDDIMRLVENAQKMKRIPIFITRSNANTIDAKIKIYIITITNRYSKVADSQFFSKTVGCMLLAVDDFTVLTEFSEDYTWINDIKE